MAKLRDITADRNKEVQGVWLPVGEGFDVKVARMPNPKFNARLQELGRPYRSQLRRGQYDAATVEKLTTEAMAETVLLDWRGLEDDDGNPIPYSQQKAKELLSDNSSFAEIVQELASDYSNFQYDLEESKDNLGKSGNGGTNGATSPSSSNSDTTQD